MIGFLRKDFYMLYEAYKKNLLLVFVLYAGLVLVTKNTFFGSILIWMMAFYGLSAITMDGSCGWDCYARTLPVSNGAVITARFLVTLIMVGISFAFSMILCGILYYFMDYGELQEMVVPNALITAAALIAIGLMFPAAYKWGVEKVRNSFLLVFMAVFLTPLALKKWMDLDSVEALARSLEEIPTAAVMGMALGAGLLVYAFGGWLSVRVYAKKEF